MAIRSYGARRTKRFVRGDRRVLPSALVGRIEPLLNALDHADSLADLDLPGARLHALKGDRKGFFALELSGNWRLVFRFEDGDAYDVEVVDYHRS
ncbi:MAG: type II toxin-antitoxin system RelE/ParE family toxin [Bryobacterales bacterium]|nr:type II toxin-antitoxin system RelE/ParE family toxin [Bryobacterales bacterium]MDE0623197.1 type II toxin-antitoxin system RelE/ParE family toxin [Bryobacterales bacterium]